MVDVKTETKIQNHQPVNPRAAIREARQRRLRLIKGDRPTTVKVYAANETYRQVLRHANGTRFRDDGSTEWPNDSFTARRIADGSVRTDGAGSDELAEPDESLNPRQQAAANNAKAAKEEHSSKNGSKSQPHPEPHSAA